jgi:hypothetical protein
MRFSTMVVLGSALLLTSCAWVELTQDAQHVRILSASDASACNKLGQTTASVADNIGGVKRRDDIVQANLEKLARNSAADMKGDAIVPASPIKDGRQSFDVYRCSP